MSNGREEVKYYVGTQHIASEMQGSVVTCP